jgi:hypothetical protein
MLTRLLALSSRRPRSRRYHSPCPCAAAAAAASVAPSSVCSTVDDVNTSAGVAETNRRRRRSMHRMKRSRRSSSVDRSMSQSHCLLFAICMEEFVCHFGKLILHHKSETHLALRFWNQVFTCRSLRLSSMASFRRSSGERYL